MNYKSVINEFKGEAHVELALFRESTVGRRMLIAAEKQRRFHLLQMLNAALQSSDPAVVKAAVSYKEMSELVVFFLGKDDGDAADPDSTGQANG